MDKNYMLGLIKRLVEPGPDAPQTCNDEGVCFWCNTICEDGEHSPDCPYVEATTFLEC